MMTTTTRLSPKIRLSQLQVQLGQYGPANLSFQYLNENCQLVLAPSPSPASWCALNYLWEGEDLTLYVPAEHLCKFLEPNLQGLIFNDLNESLQLLFLQTVQNVFVDIFGQFKMKLTPKPMQEKMLVTLEENTCFNMVKDGTEIFQWAIASSNPIAIQFLTQLYKHIKPSTRLQGNTLTFPFRIQLGGARLSFQELWSLRLGDIILSQSEKNILHFYWQNIRFLAEKNNTTILVKSNLMENTNDELPVGIIPEESTTADVPVGAVEEPSAPVEATPPPQPTFPVNQLPVCISFDAGTHRLTFEQLQQLHEGYTFVLDKTIDDNVDILANGQCIGQGEWVQINEHLGVRITHLNLQ